MEVRLQMDTDRRSLAAQIAEYGPMDGDELRAALGWRIGQFHDAVYKHRMRWFVLTIRGWDLTEVGWNGLAASGQPVSE